jgi:HEAT repeat protein
LRFSKEKISKWLAAKVVASSIKNLSDKDSSVRTSAANNLGKIWDETAVIPLYWALLDPVSEVRTAASQALQKIGVYDVESVSILLNNENPKIRAMAIQLLGQLGGKPAIDKIIQVLNDETLFPYSLSALERLVDSSSVQAVEPLTAVFFKKPCAKLSAVRALAKIGKPAFNSFICALKDESPEVREIAAEALWDIADVKSIEPLSQSLGDENVETRRYAVRTFAKIGRPALQPLVQALKDQDRWVRETAYGALGELMDERDEQAVKQIFLPVLDDDNGHIRLAAIKALGRIKHAKSVEKFIMALNDVDFHIRFAAIEALGVIGDTRAVEPLLEMLKGNNEFVCDAAAQALGRIGKPAVKPLFDVANTTVKAAENLNKKLGLEHWPYYHSSSSYSSKCADFSLSEQFYYVIKALQATNDDLAADMLIKEMSMCAYQDFGKIVKTALLGMGELAKERLFNALRNEEDSQSACILLYQLGWQPDNPVDKAYLLIASGKWDELVELGKPSIEPLTRILNDEKSRSGEDAAKTLYKIGWEPNTPDGKARFFFLLKKWDELVSLGPLAVRTLVHELDRCLNRTYCIDNSTNIVETLGRIDDERALNALVGIVENKRGPQWDAVKALANTGNQRYAELVLSWLLNHLIDRFLISNLDLKKLFGGYSEIIKSLTDISCSTTITWQGVNYDHGTYNYELSKSDEAVHQLCRTPTPTSSNILHLVAKRTDFEVTTSWQCLYAYTGTLSFGIQRNDALAELDRRGFPSYNPSVYLDKNSWML